MCEQSSLAEQGAMAELQGKQRAQEIEEVTATKGAKGGICTLSTVSEEWQSSNAIQT